MSLVFTNLCPRMTYSMRKIPFYQKVKADNPELKVTEISKVLGEKWGKLDEIQKKPYQDKADEDKARYKRERDAYDSKKAAREEPQQSDSNDSDAASESD